MKPPAHLHPHDVGLPVRVIRKRHQARRIAQFMLIIAVLTAIAGWLLYGTSIFFALKIRDESPYRVILAYALLLISSITLVLGFWYLLLAQVSRVARMVDADHIPDELHPPQSAPTRCHNCGWPHDPADRFCRHCGKPLGTSIIAPGHGPTPHP